MMAYTNYDKQDYFQIMFGKVRRIKFYFLHKLEDSGEENDIFFPVVMEYFLCQIQEM